MLLPYLMQKKNGTEKLRQNSGMGRGIRDQLTQWCSNCLVRSREGASGPQVREADQVTKIQCTKFTKVHCFQKHLQKCFNMISKSVWFLLLLMK